MTPARITLNVMKPKNRKHVTCLRAGCLLLGIPCTLVGAFVLFISLLSPPLQAASLPPPFAPDFTKGIVMESWWNSEFASDDCEVIQLGTRYNVTLSTPQ